MSFEITNTSCQGCNEIFAGIFELNALRDKIRAKQDLIQQLQDSISPNLVSSKKNQHLDARIGILLTSVESLEINADLKVHMLMHKIAQHHGLPAPTTDA